MNVSGEPGHCAWETFGPIWDVTSMYMGRCVLFIRSLYIPSSKLPNLKDTDIFCHKLKVFLPQSLDDITSIESFNGEVRAGNQKNGHNIAG